VFNPHKITQAEIEFIRVYVRAMKREYHVLQSVLALMNPTDLGIRCVVEATRAAKELQEMQAEFEQSLHALSVKHRAKAKKIVESPTDEELADLFTLSFFKVVSPTPAGKKDEGWFSGEPEMLVEMFKTLQKADKTKLPNLLSSYLNAAFKLFSLQNKKYPLADDPLSHWNLPPQTFKFNATIEYYSDDDDWEEDDEDDDEYYTDEYGETD
jgi:hypothetical protein